jgi:hypothetical protein
MKIYGLFDPRTSELRYVGMTSRTLKERLNKHLHDNTKTHKTCWIKSLKNINLIPEIFLFEEVPDNEWQYWEKWYITYFKSIGE